MGARRSEGQDGGRRQAQQPGVAESGGRRERHLRVLPRLRPDRLRPRRQAAVGDAARSVQQHLRHGRVAGDRRRQHHPGVRPEPGLVRDGGQQAHRPRGVEGRSARSQERPFDADRLARSGPQGSDHPARFVPAHLLRRRHRQEAVVGRRAVVRDEIDAGDRRRHDLRQRLRRAGQRSGQQGDGADGRRGVEDRRRRRQRRASRRRSFRNSRRHSGSTSPTSTSTAR